VGWLGWLSGWLVGWVGWVDWSAELAGVVGWLAGWLGKATGSTVVYARLRQCVLDRGNDSWSLNYGQLEQDGVHGWEDGPVSSGWAAFAFDVDSV
jgi:hypothetical protein